jgi:hypothetical protein
MELAAMDTDGQTGATNGAPRKFIDVSKEEDDGLADIGGRKPEHVSQRLYALSRNPENKSQVVTRACLCTEIIKFFPSYLFRCM